MQEFLNKKISELSVLEGLKYSYLVSICSNITMSLEEFCKVTGKDKRKVYTLLKNRIFPEHIIVGGYENKEKRKSPIFITKEVLNYISNE